MSPRRWLPTPAELDEAPELAILAALDDTLETALRALVAAHPQLGDSECPAWVRRTSAASAAADRILHASKRLAHALDAYRRAVTPRRDTETEPNPHF
jgi:hypothetical protein